MPKKKVDSRVRTLVENGLKTRHRSIFVVVGDKGRDQVVNLHYMLSKASVRTRPTVLWCYKKNLGFTSHRQKRAKKIKRDIARGIRGADEENPFDLFISSTDIRYTFYKETASVLGNTFGMCVLQDFGSLTPNLLARTIETVEGGGLIVILLKTMQSLKQLYTMSMDVHKRFRTEAHGDIVPRFNERFLLSLAGCENCLFVDDELNILPISSRVAQIQKIGLPTNEDGSVQETIVSENQIELLDLKSAMHDTQPVGSLVDACLTLDQAKVVLNFMEAISEKTLKSTVVLTAARGRGKSAAMGISIAGAIACGYANIFVTAPSPENLHTLFKMVFKGFDALEFKEHQDYEIVQSTNPALNKAVVRVNIFRSHRQTIQYIQPQDSDRLSQAELVVIDEAAAIPLPMVKALMGPYLVFMSSTVNGYEGTGRSLSLKLVRELRYQSVSGPNGGSISASAASSRTLRELELQEPIRYATSDPVEKWLSALLCLDCATNMPRLGKGLPHPSQCQLYRVNRDTLFSHHKASEAFLQQFMSLLVSSHYKNTPDDIQLMSDAPAHRLFVLLGPESQSDSIPDLLCIVQVALEGLISKESILASVSRGQSPSGDMIPWVISQQYQNSEFASLSGARIVRIATHPDATRMGYGSRALQLITNYYEGLMMGVSDPITKTPQVRKKLSQKSATALEEDSDDVDAEVVGDSAAAADALRSEPHDSISPRTNLPPLLSELSEPEESDGPQILHWLGVSYGLTQELYDFWRRSSFSPVYLAQVPNLTTGEHSCIMLRALQGSTTENLWLNSFTTDFRRRLLSLFSFQFRSFVPALALSLCKKDAALTANSAPTPRLSFEQLSEFLDHYDLTRLDSYSKNLIDYHTILDLVPIVARLFYLERFGEEFRLNNVQSAILLSVGLQHKRMEDLKVELKIEHEQILANFYKIMHKVSSLFRSIEASSIRNELVEQSSKSKPSEKLPKAAKMASLDSELTEVGKRVSNSKASPSAPSGAPSLLSELKLPAGPIPSSISLKAQARSQDEGKRHVDSSAALSSSVPSKKFKR